MLKRFLIFVLFACVYLCAEENVGFKLTHVHETIEPLINMEDLQGLVMDDEYIYISNMKTVYRVPRDSLSKEKIISRRLQSFEYKLRGGYYRHFGGMEMYNDTLYIAVTGRKHYFTTKKATPVVVVLDKDLNFVKYGIFPKEIQKGAGWISVNSTDGLLYSAWPFGYLHAYSREFENGDTISFVKNIRLDFLDNHLIDSVRSGLVNQGGVFSKEGFFFYAADHKTCSSADFQGIHLFDIKDSVGTEIPLYGYNNYGERRDFINFKYNAGVVGQRLWEGEDLDLIETDTSATLYWMILLNVPSPYGRLMEYHIDPAILKKKK
ncbi:MAG: hypothetical protein J6A06_08245 [Fibrobacteraceae bacterium]|nr:hypothetical protein [Fibrobacteraceae bacterium]